MGCMVNENILFCFRIKKTLQALRFRMVVSGLGTDAGQQLRGASHLGVV